MQNRKYFRGGVFRYSSPDGFSLACVPVRHGGGYRWEITRTWDRFGKKESASAVFSDLRTSCSEKTAGGFIPCGCAGYFSFDVSFRLSGRGGSLRMSSRVCDDSVFPLIPDIIRGVRKSGPGVLSASGNGCTGTAADVRSMMCGDSFTAFRTAPGKNGPGVWTFVFGCAHGGGMQEAMPCLRFGGLTDSDADALAAFFSAAVRQTLAAERRGTEKAEKTEKAEQENRR